MPDPTEARKALYELLDLLREVDERFLSPEWLIQSPQDVAEGMRAVMHALQGGLQGWFETNAEHPEFRRIVAPWRKFTGDNADAIYFDAAIRGDRRYRVRGRMDGAVYVSLTIEAGSQDGRMGGRTDGVINDTQLDVDRDGCFEVLLGGPKQERNWIALPPDASRVTTRHYYEDETCAAADPKKHPALSIEVLDRVARATPPNDADRCRRAAPRLELRARTHARDAAAGEARAAGLRVHHAEPVPRALLARRPRPRRARRLLLDGALPAQPRPGAGDPRALAHLPLRERRSLEPLPADLRLRHQAGHAQPQADEARARRQLPRS